MIYKITKGLNRVEWEEEIEFRNIKRGHDLSFNREAFRSKTRNDFVQYVNIRRNLFYYFTRGVSPQSGTNCQEK